MTVYVESTPDGAWYGLMVADTEVELHAMARRVGAAPEGCQRHRDPALKADRREDTGADVRYLLTPEQRYMAALAGAVLVEDDVLGRMRARRRRDGRLPVPDAMQRLPMRPRAALQPPLPAGRPTDDGCAACMEVADA